MTASTKTQPRLRIFLLWGLLLAIILVWPVFLLWESRGQPTPAEQPGMVRFIIMLVLGGMAFCAGILGYLATVFTQCLTFNFTQPVWHQVKVKQFIVNIIFQLMIAIGMGFFSSAFFTPLAAQFNLPGQMAFMLPFFGAIILTQILFICILVWAPLEKRIIVKRLAALGVTSEQLRGGLYIGLSNPAITSTAKRFCSIEEDMGMLWFTRDQMIYWGDCEQWAIERSNIALVERKADTKSNTMLSSTAHVILRLRDNLERQIRFHTEGIWTIFGKRRASDDLGARINTWLAAIPGQNAGAPVV